jgi:hypothetical protein
MHHTLVCWSWSHFGQFSARAEAVVIDALAWWNVFVDAFVDVSIFVHFPMVPVATPDRNGDHEARVRDT